MQAMRMRQVLLHGVGAEVRAPARLAGRRPPRLRPAAGSAAVCCVQPALQQPPGLHCFQRRTNGALLLPCLLPLLLQLHPDASNLNISHTLHTLRFGPAFPGQARAALHGRRRRCHRPCLHWRFPGSTHTVPTAPPDAPAPADALQANPLEGASQVDRKSTGVDKYFLKVVRFFQML